MYEKLNWPFKEENSNYSYLNEPLSRTFILLTHLYTFLVLIMVVFEEVVFSGEYWYGCTCWGQLDISVVKIIVMAFSSTL